MADDRTYVRVHDGMPNHPKIVAAGGDAGWLWQCGLCYCGNQLTNGRIPKAIVPRLSDRRQPMRLAARLVEVGLWEDQGDHFLMHDYLEHNRSAEEVAELKAKRREAGSRGGKAKASRVANGKQVLQQMPSKMPSKSVPDTETDTDLHPQTTDSCSEPAAVGEEAAKPQVKGTPSRSDVWSDERNRPSTNSEMVTDWGKVLRLASQGNHTWRDHPDLSPIARAAASECAVTIRMERADAARVAFYEAWKRLALEGVS